MLNKPRHWEKQNQVHVLPKVYKLKLQKKISRIICWSRLCNHEPHYPHTTIAWFLFLFQKKKRYQMIINFLNPATYGLLSKKPIYILWSIFITRISFKVQQLCPLYCWLWQCHLLGLVHYLQILFFMNLRWCLLSNIQLLITY